MKTMVTKFALLAGCLMLAGATHALAQEAPQTPAQVVALDECDPATFNAALGPAFCHNVALGASTTLKDLFDKAIAGTPDPNWDFEPDVVSIKKGTPIIVVDQGGEPHTFTEVAHFGEALLKTSMEERSWHQNVPVGLKISPSPKRASCKAASSR
jgi:hypothetical protein